jgi:hypothetical protein
VTLGPVVDKNKHIAVVLVPRLCSSALPHNVWFLSLHLNTLRCKRIYFLSSHSPHPVAARPRPQIYSAANMVPPTTNIPDMTSPIMKVPPELLEQVLLEAVSNAIPPFTSHKSHDDLRYRFRLLKDLSATLGFRLTSKAFRDVSWRALAAVIGETIYDMRSKRSMENLENMSQCLQLAPWITKLHISVGDCRRANLNQLQIDKLNENSTFRLREMMEAEQTWFPELWSTKHLKLSDPHQVPPLQSYQSRNRDFENKLANCFARLKNLGHACFVCDHWMTPGRYRSISWYGTENNFPLWYNTPTRAELHGHLGLEIFTSALATAGTCVKTLELSVDLDDYHAFITNVPEAVMAKACRNVWHLKIWNKYFPLYSEYFVRRMGEPRIAPTRSVFPALLSLTIDHCNTFRDPYVVTKPLPSLFDVPQLSELTILNADFEDPHMVSFIQLYGTGVERLRIKSVKAVRLTKTLQALKRLKPNHLTIEYFDDAFWDYDKNQIGLGHIDEVLRQEILSDFPNGFEKELAKTVVLGPANFVQVLEKHWAAEGNRSEGGSGP